MKIEELNTFLRNNIHASARDFLSGNPFEDEYANFRNDASIYCYSAMTSVVKQTSSNPQYASWMQNAANHIALTETQHESEEQIISRAIDCVKSDGDDLCDEQSVGWYLGVYTYMHCLAFGLYSFEQLFLQNWKKYFSVEYQNQIRGIHVASADRVLVEDITDFMGRVDDYRTEIIDAKYDLKRQGFEFMYHDDDAYVDALCEAAKSMYRQKPSKNKLLCLTMAISSLYHEKSMQIYMPNGLCILANKIISE